ncbi:hypothetical protein IW261DRAFT_1444764, partial [Armillaria novae-zelandiae]
MSQRLRCLMRWFVASFQFYSLHYIDFHIKQPGPTSNFTATKFMIPVLHRVWPRALSITGRQAWGPVINYHWWFPWQRYFERDIDVAAIHSVAPRLMPRAFCVRQVNCYRVPTTWNTRLGIPLWYICATKPSFVLIHKGIRTTFAYYVIRTAVTLSIEDVKLPFDARDVRDRVFRERRSHKHCFSAFRSSQVKRLIIDGFKAVIFDGIHVYEIVNSCRYVL